MKKLFGLWLMVFSLWSGSAYAGEITVIYTGSTHAMLYPCSCPKETDGGIARRATLVKQLRKKYPDALLLDSGNFFSGGLMDEYTQNTQLDMQRTEVNLKAIELMKYDAVAISPDEFNFGYGFFNKKVVGSKAVFLSSNIDGLASEADIILPRISPYIIKEISGIKVGITAITNPVAKQKAGIYDFVEPKKALRKSIEELKGKTDLIIVLSNLSEEDNLSLIRDIGSSIDILVTNYRPKDDRPSQRINSTFILNPDWQARKLGVATFTWKDGKITSDKIELLRLSDKIKDDAEIKGILPVCFSDMNCKKNNLIGTCHNPGTMQSDCVFSQANKIKLLAITSRECLTCNTKTVVDFLKTQFPGLEASYLYYPLDKKADNLVKDFAIGGLPAYLLGKDAEKEKNFDNLKNNLELKRDFYLLKPHFSGVSYFLNRKKIKQKLDLFISLYDQATPKLLEVIKEFNPALHFLAVEQQGNFEAAKGRQEVEEYLRSVCVQKYYPEQFFDYLTCRSKNINSSWWEDCLAKFDSERIRACAKGDEGRLLLRENISLNRELQVMFGPTYLVDNQEIFGSTGVPDREELKKLLRR
ncbi:MAG: hypothetical protein PHT41_05630 [Candidatus Omnitrophica bacterium]|nr:hypothetical protein [Candidatus Omnitrophota bacterium]